MSNTIRLIFLVLLTIFSGQLIAEKANLNSVYRLMDQKRYQSAAKRLESLVKQHPQDADAWYFYGLALLRDKQFDRAETVISKAANFDGYAKFNQFNLGLIHAERGDHDKAMKLVGESIHAGYLNFDRLKTESALNTLREQGKISFAPEQDYDSFTAHNRIKVPYKVLLPNNFDKSKTYKGLVAFPPGNFGPASADWLIENLFNNQANNDWVITVVLAPEDGLINHPSHHALNDLMKHIRKQYQIAGNKFHFLGYHGGGQPAATYSQMSKSYINGVTTIGAYAWEDWQDKHLDGFADTPTRLIVGRKDKAGVKINQHAYNVMKSYQSPIDLTIIDYDGAEVTAVSRGKIFDYLP